MKKTFLSIFVTMTLIISISSSVLADDIADQKDIINKQQQEYDSAKDNLDMANASVEEVESKIQELENKMYNLGVDINKKEAEIGAAEDEISAAESDIEKNQNDIDDEQELYDKRMRAMYINGNESYVTFILKSESFSDLISRSEIVKDMISYDKEIIEDLNAKKEELEKKKVALEEKKEKLTEEKTELEASKAQVEETKEERMAVLAELESRQDEIEAENASIAAKLEEANKELNRLVEEQKAEAARKAAAAAAASASNGTNPSRGETTTATGLSIVDYADNYIGCPYLWGATGQVLSRSMINWATSQGSGFYSPILEQYVGTTQAFDCSGLVYYTFAHFGVYLPRTTYYQVNCGSYVPKDQLQPGDLIFYGSSWDVHHVAIYYGNGLIIEAPRTGKLVRISNAFRSDYYTARRIL